MDLFDYSMSAVGAFGLFILNGLNSKVNNVEVRLRNHELDTAKEYVRKADMLHELTGIKDTIHQIDNKLDKIDEKLDKKADK